MKRILCFAIIFVLLSSVFIQISSASQGFTEDEKNTQKQNKIIVLYNEDQNANVSSPVSTKIKKVKKLDAKTEVVEIDKKENVDMVINEYKKNPSVKSVEKNRVLKTYAVPNDTYFSNQWGFSSVKADKVWNQNSYAQRAVVVAVIDSGIDIDHPDLVNRIAPGGYNFFNDNYNVDDAFGHGTAVSGAIAAEVNNYIGIAGVSGAFDIKILPLKTANANGDSYTSDIIDAINYAISQHVDVINFSMGSNVSSTSERLAVQNAVKAGITVVAAAGNTGDNQYGYPASYSNVISVGAMASDTLIAPFSSYNNMVDIAAPGSYIYTCQMGGNYAYYSGTSLSSPIVTGLVAVIKSLKPTLTPAQIDTLIESTATDKGVVGKDVYFGAGEIDAYAAVKETLKLPVSDVSISKSTLMLTPNMSETLIPTIDPILAYNQNVLWSSSDSLIASVDDNGKVTAKKVGTATITVNTLDGNKTATCEVTVNPIAVTDISINKTSIIIMVGESETLDLEVYPLDATNQTVIWTSDHPDVATIDLTGKITALKEGITSIKATSNDGNFTETCALRVVSNVSSSNQYIVQSPVMTDEDDSFILNLPTFGVITVSENIRNTSSELLNTTVVFALYDNNKLVKLQFESATIPIGAWHDFKTLLIIPPNSANHHVKVMTLGDFTTLKPMVPASFLVK